MSYLINFANQGKNNIVENSTPLQKLHLAIGPVMRHSGEVLSFKALTRRPNTVKATLSEVYMANRLC